MNPIYEIIEDVLIGALERDSYVWLPEEFEIRLEDADFKGLLRAGLVYANKKPVPLTAMRVLVTIQGYRILVRSDQDPEDWAMVPHKESLQ